MVVKFCRILLLAITLLAYLSSTTSARESYQLVTNLDVDNFSFCDIKATDLLIAIECQNSLRIYSHVIAQNL